MGTFQERLMVPMRTGEALPLAGATLLSLALVVLFGRLAPDITPDTEGYVALAAWPAVLEGMRTPFYGWTVAPFAGSEPAFALVPALQAAAWTGAVWFLVASLRRYGVSRKAALSVGFALLFANAFHLMVDWIHPEVPALAALAVAVGAVARLAGGGRPIVWLPLVLLGAGWGTLARPSFLPFVGMLPVLFVLLVAIRREGMRIGLATAVLLAATAPVAGWVGLRAATVGGVAVAPFGGFAMSGMAGLMLTPAIVERLPDDVRPLAERVLAARTAGEAEGRLIGVPRNSSGDRSFHSAALGYFDVLARTYDEVAWGIVLRERAADEPWPAFDARVGRFATAVIVAAPDRWVAWVAGATTRLVGRGLTANLPFLLATAACVLLWPLMLLRRPPPRPADERGADVPVLIALAGGWFAAAGLLTVLMTFPALRYVDSAALLLPALPIYAAWSLVDRLRERR